MQDKSKCLPIKYGKALTKHLTQIYNQRITYPTQDIYLWDDDEAGAFRHIKYNPEIAAAFSFTIGHYLFLATGLVFGSTTSAEDHEIIATARKLLAYHISRDWKLLNKHKTLLKQVKYSSPAKKGTKFTPAIHKHRC